jgi:hypothetical protein
MEEMAKSCWCPKKMPGTQLKAVYKRAKVQKEVASKEFPSGLPKRNVLGCQRAKSGHRGKRNSAGRGLGSRTRDSHSGGCSTGWRERGGSSTLALGDGASAPMKDWDVGKKGADRWASKSVGRGVCTPTPEAHSMGSGRDLGPNDLWWGTATEEEGGGVKRAEMRRLTTKR